MKRRFFAFTLTLLTAIAAWADIDFGTESTVSKTTTWTFNDLTTGTKYYEDAPATNGFPLVNNAYLRTQKPGRCFEVKEVESTAITLSDKRSLNVTKILSLNAASGDLSKLTASGTANTYTDSHKATGVFALNATVAGTLYVYMKGATGSKNSKLRIYHSEKVGSNGSLSAVVNTEVSDTELKTISYTSSAKGVFYICSADNTCDIYAVHFVSSEAEPETVSVFLTAGQSNTAGRCMNENLPDYIKTLGEANDGAYRYCNWSYTNGSTRKSESEGVLRKFWPEMESANNSGRFAYDAIVYYWIEQALQKDFYVVKHAMGGTSIDPTCTSSKDYHWSADATWLSEHVSCNDTDGTSMLKALCSNIDQTLDAIEALGKTPDVKCMIWHQGESDRSGTGPDGYHDNLKAVVQYVRNYLVTKTGDSKYATLDFIAGTVPTNSSQYNKKVYDALFTLASEDEHFHVIETSPGTFIGDNLHFDTNCAERLGIGMYNKMVDLGLVDGEQQTVPEAILPEETTITLDFSTWTKDNIELAATYVNLQAEATSSVTALDGTTAMYKIVGSDADADFSEFAETFALATPANIQLRGAGHGLFANKKQSLLSLLNLEAGDRVNITTKAGDGGNSLKFVSTNAYKDGDATKTAVTTETEWVSGESYVVTSNTQLDLLFGINTSTTSYIYKVVIEKGAVEISESESADSNIYYLSPTGSDSNNGYTQETAFATMSKVQSVVKHGDTVYILPGTYSPTDADIMRTTGTTASSYSIIYDMSVSGKANSPISYIGVLDDEGKRPVFDLSGVGESLATRITGFLVTGSYLLFKNLDIKGVQQQLAYATYGNQQSENVRISDASHTTFENVSCHDSEGIGFYIHGKSSYNLIVNCDAYNNYDPLSYNANGGNCDGFGCHVQASCDNNIFIGCRAWNNSDDGFDLINCYSPVTFSYSIGYKNGYDATNTARGDGNGFKAGGFGMQNAITLPASGAPRHEIYHSIAADNRSNGFYANHHLGGLNFYRNTSVDNQVNSWSANYNMINRKGAGSTSDDLTDVDGYDHQVHHNLSVGSNSSRHITHLAVTDTDLYWDNSFYDNDGSWANTAVDRSTAFADLTSSNLTADRNASGMLSSTTQNYAKQTTDLGYGADFGGYEEAVTAAKALSGAEAEEIVSYAVSETTLWTFDELDNGAISGSTVYDHHHLFISGHGSDESNQATVVKENRSDVVLDDAASPISVSKRLDIAGTYASQPTAATKVNTFVRDCIGFYAGVKGTVYIFASAAAAGRGLKIIVDGEEETLPNVMTAAYTPVVNSKKIAANSDVFITSTSGGWRIHAIKFVADAADTPDEPTGTPVVHMCGDSMMSIYGDESSDASANATYTQGMRGWGQFFQDYFTEESGIVVQDWAHTGTTAKGFYSGANYWPVVMGDNTMTDAYKAERPYVKDFVPVKAGDYVIMCWGHNDQKGGSLHNGYKTLEESEYITYLTTMVNEVKAKGAYPILATSICRSLFSGKTLTRLGKIDACEAAGETHSDSDDLFDYPAAMRNLATALGVPCIDLNAASQELWEDFGPGLTASVFFEGVGTTHTAEKGARAMGIAANLIIRGWDTTSETYQDYATLQAAMKTDVAQYAKADYATSETVVASETVWTFEQSADGETTYASGDVIADGLLDYNGLYLRGYETSGHEFKAQGVTGSFTFSNDKQVSWSMGAITSAMSSTPCSEASTAGQAVTTSTDRCIALNTSGAGTFYVAMRTKGDPTSGRYFKMAFNGTEVDSKASSKSVTELKYHAEEAGVFYAWGTESYIVVAAYYVPDADTSEDEMHEPGSTVSVTIGSQGYSSFSNSEALDFSEVDGLKAYVVSSVNAAGKAVLSEVSSVPAQTGLILKGTAGKEYAIPVATSAPSAPASNLLVATVTATPVAASTDDMHNYMFANGSNGLGFYYVRTATTSAAGKAYLCTGATALDNASSGSHSFVFDDDITTGISEELRVNSEESAGAIYDLQGRRVANAEADSSLITHHSSLKKGLYIVNGKKVIIK